MIDDPKPGTMVSADDYLALMDVRDKAVDIVRRLAENEKMRADEWVRLIVDAKELWAKMKGSEE